MNDARRKLSTADAHELERFTIFLRAVNQARAAGVPHVIAMDEIYQDVYRTNEPEVSK